MPDDMTALRGELFKHLRAVEKGDRETLARAKTAAQVGAVLIDSAKAEIAFLKVGNGQGSSFISAAPALPAAPETPASTVVVKHGNGVRVTRHTLKG